MTARSSAVAGPSPQSYVLDTSAVLRYLDGKIPYADCFGIELALDPPARILLTADFDVKPAADAVHIEFLPVK